MFISACSIHMPESLTFAEISSPARWDMGKVS